MFRMRAPAIALLSLLLAACGAPKAPEAPAAARTEAKSAPDFSLQDLDGKTVKLSDYAGRVRLVDFWATWCAPCREEIPTFKDLHARYGERGFTIIGIAMDDEGGPVVGPFVKEHAMPYVNLLGNEEVGNAYGPLRGLPTKFLLDKDGKIVDTFFGAVPKSVLEKKIQALL